jgi:hypothetical protein
MQVKGSPSSLKKSCRRGEAEAKIIGSIEASLYQNYPGFVICN